MMNPEPERGDPRGRRRGPAMPPFLAEEIAEEVLERCSRDGGCASGPPLAAGAAAAWVVEILTTTPTSLAAS